jgi:hypothetical protein
MGMAWQIYPYHRDIGPYLFKDGGTSGMHSATALVPHAGLGISIRSNGSAPPGSMVAAFADRLIGESRAPVPAVGDAGATC